MVWWPKANARQDDDSLPARLRYEVHGPSGRLSGGMEPPSALPKGLSCLVLLHPGDVGLFEVSVPKLSGRKLQDALPYLVEPHLLNDPEDNWVSLCGNLAQGKRLAAVVDKNTARTVLRACKQLKLNVSALSCELLREPAQVARCAWFSELNLLVIDGQSIPVALDASQPALFPRLFARLAAPNTSPLLMSAPDQQRLQSLLNQEGLATQLAGKAVASPIVGLKNKGLVPAQELRKSGLSGVSESSEWAPLLRAAGATAVLLVLGLNLLAFKANRQLDALDNAINTRYQQALPNVPMVADPLLLINREKQSLTAGQSASSQQGASGLLHEVGMAMNQAPFNSLLDIGWSDNTLNLKFANTLTQQHQDAALTQLKARGLDARWTTTGLEKWPTLQVKGGKP